jgi:hypothetical protein
MMIEIGGFKMDMDTYREVKAAFDGEPRRPDATPSDWLYRFDARTRATCALSDPSKSLSAAAICRLLEKESVPSEDHWNWWKAAGRRG